MKLPHIIRYHLQPETVQAHEPIPSGTVMDQRATMGASLGEPLLVIFDALLSYAKSYESAMGQKLAEDPCAKPEFASLLSGAHGMLNFNGGVANARNLTSDSKDNTALDTLYRVACEAAGFDPETL